MMPTREEMHRTLQERYGAELQARFDAGRVVVYGPGGLGSNVATALARAGVGHLHLIDFDRVDLTNLNRQQYTVEQPGQYKTRALAETLRRIALYCEILTDTVRVVEENLPALLEKGGTVRKAFDRPEVKVIPVSGVLERFPDKPLAAASGMARLGSANTIRTRRASGRLYLCGDGTSDVSGVLGLVSAWVAVCVAHQVHIIFWLLVGETES